MKTMKKIIIFFVLIIFIFLLLFIAVATDKTLNGTAIDCTQGYTFCDDFNGTTLDKTHYQDSATASIVQNDSVTINSVDVGNNANSVKWNLSYYKIFNNTFTWCMETKFSMNGNAVNGVYQQLNTKGGYNGNVLNLGYLITGLSPNMAVYGYNSNILLVNRITTNMNITERICHVGGDVLQYRLFNNTGQMNSSRNISLPSMIDAAAWSVLNFNNGVASGLKIYYQLAWNGSESDAPYLVPPVDTCSCVSDGDWNMDCTQNCVLNSNCEMQVGSIFKATGSGRFLLNANISGFSIFESANQCKIEVNSSSGGII